MITHPPPALDTQQVEIVGRNLLITRLVSSGLEVARPERDRGIDLIAYLDREPEGGFRAVPLQLKAASTRSVSADRKYERIPGLHVVFAWQVAEPRAAEFFCLSPDQIHALAGDMGWPETDSWKLRGKYTTNKPSARLCGLLEPHRMCTAADWLRSIRGGRAGAAGPA
jgi:hypothetical protein